MIRIDPLNSWSCDDADALLDAAFGADRRGRTAYRIRRGMAWLTGLSFAAVEVDDSGDRGEMVGLLQSWPVALLDASGRATPMVMVGPVAVAPAHQGGGHGRSLMDRLIAAATTAASDPLVMIGDEPYYGRFWSFSAAATGGWKVPGPVDPARLLARTVRNDGVPLPATGMLGPRLATAGEAAA